MAKKRDYASSRVLAKLKMAGNWMRKNTRATAVRYAEAWHGLTAGERAIAKVNGWYRPSMLAPIHRQARRIERRKARVCNFDGPFTN